MAENKISLSIAGLNLLITTPEDEVKGAGILLKGDPDDPFYILNNAVVFEQMFQYGRAEEILTEYLKKPKHYNAQLMN